MRRMLILLTAMGMLGGGWVFAQSGPEVLKAKGCLNCHETDKKKVGPGYKDVAAKYKDDKGAEARLVTKIKEGNNHPKIAASDAELKAAVEYVLQMK